MSGGETARRIMDVAEGLLRRKGYNGFSFRDVAARIGIKSASVHHHFATKESLCAAVVARYAGRFADALGDLDRAGRSARWTLVGYAGLYREALADGRICLCGILASEAELTPEVVRVEVARFFEDQRRWLTGVVTRGAADGSLARRLPAEEAALMLLAALQGGMVLARGGDDLRRFDDAVRAAILRLTPAGAVPS